MRNYIMCAWLMLCTLLTIVGCSSVDLQPERSAFEDAVRIKPEAAHKYVQLMVKAYNQTSLYTMGFDHETYVRP